MINRQPQRACCTALAFALLCCASTLTYAADNGHWYAAAKVSFSEDTMENHTGTGMVIGGQVDGELDNDTIDDYTAGVGFAVGRRLGDWNISGEYIYRYRTDWDLVIATPSIQAITNIFSNVESHILMLNVARRMPIHQNWSWEAGAGLGVTFKYLDAEYKRARNPHQSATALQRHLQLSRIQL